MRPRHRAALLPAAALTAALLFAPLTARAQDTTYVVQPGDSLFRIAQIYSVDVNALAQHNAIANTWRIYSGQTLMIPGTTTDTAAAPDTAPAIAPPITITHTVQRGETLASIARQHGLTTDALAQQNSITNPNLIYTGQVLTIAAPAVEADPAAVPALTAPEVVLDPAQIYDPNAPLIAAPALEQVLNNGQPLGMTPERYTVQRGEYLSQIAQRFGTSATALAQANNIYDPNTVFAGQSLIIPGTSVPSGGTYSTYDGALPTFGLDMAFAAPPAPTGIGREILVDLSDSRAYAYENGVLVRNVLASMGLPATPTVQGDFTVQRKYVSQYMAGPGYYLPDVPYILYFYQGYALHGTYWHENWGQPMSRGCVNLPTPEAEWFFNFAEIGTPVRVQA